MERKTERILLAPGVVSLRVGELKEQKLRAPGDSSDGGCFRGCFDCTYDVECERAPDPIKKLEQKSRRIVGQKA